LVFGAPYVIAPQIENLDRLAAAWKVLCQHCSVGKLLIAAIAGALAGATLGWQSAAMPSAHAAPCPDAEVIFARGTTEQPGVGPTGDAFVEALRAQVGGRSLDVYPVNYPAALDFATAVQGIADARAHILSTAANCPDTKMVLGGFSQGAAVIGFVTASVVPDGISPLDVPTPMAPEIADHVAAVALFGKPSTRFMRAINDPPVVVGPNYLAKTIDLCVDNDLVCDPAGTGFAVHNQYAQLGKVDQGASFVAQRLQQSWAAEAVTAEEPALSTPTPAPLSAPQEHLGSTPQPPGPAPLPGAAEAVAPSVA
jgi:hypothetical protein